MDFSVDAAPGKGEKAGQVLGQNEEDVVGLYTCKGFDDLGKCFAKLHCELSGVRDDIGKLKTTVSHLEHFAEYANTSFQEIQEKTIPNIENKITSEENERIKLDMWGRKWNLVIRGVKGDLREKPRETEREVRTFFIETLKLEESYAKSMLFSAVHRLPGGTEGYRNIIIRLNSLLDRDEVLSAAFQLTKGSGFSVVPDLPNSVSKRRATLLEKRWKMAPQEKSQYKLVYLKEFPFVDLVKKSR